MEDHRVTEEDLQPVDLLPAMEDLQREIPGEYQAAEVVRAPATAIRLRQAREPPEKCREFLPRSNHGIDLK
jgi:hypothetical protein